MQVKLEEDMNKQLQVQVANIRQHVDGRLKELGSFVVCVQAVDVEVGRKAISPGLL